MLNDQELVDIIRGIDSHLRKVDTMIALLREVRDTLVDIFKQKEQEHVFELKRTKETIALLQQQLKVYGLPTPTVYEEHFTATRSLLDSSDWPAAVPSEFICYENEEKMTQRAKSIINLSIAEPLKDIKFLDFGCGRGHVVAEAADRDAKIAIGYDPKREWKWDSRPNMVFVHDWSGVNAFGPFDVILMHDVLDHSTIDPVEMLEQARSLVNPYGRIYVKCHPWCSRHGAHLYDKLNKAFLHVAFDEVELERMGGYSYEPMQKVTNVKETYHEWFRKAGFDVTSEIPTVCELEDVFKFKSLAHDRMSKYWREDVDMINNIAFEFIDYVLEPARMKEQVL